MTSPAFLSYVLDDVLGHMSGVTTKSMFGGTSLYLDGRIFGMIAYDVLYFKVGDSNRKQYEEAGSEPFIYDGHKNKKPTAMPYWTVPEEVLHNKEAIAEWAAQSAALSKKK